MSHPWPGERERRYQGHQGHQREKGGSPAGRVRGSRGRGDASEHGRWFDDDGFDRGKGLDRR